MQMIFSGIKSIDARHKADASHFKLSRVQMHFVCFNHYMF